MPTFADQAVVSQLTAATALTQLNQLAIFARAGIGDYSPEAYVVGDKVKVRRPKITEADDYDPRSGVAAPLTELAYITGDLTLEKLFTKGFPVYSHDAPDSVRKYVNDWGPQVGYAISKSNDTYQYNKFRAWNLPATGPVQLGVHPPIAIVASQAQAGNSFADFNKQALINSGTVLDRYDVPPDMRRAILSASAKGAFLGDAVLTEGSNFTGGLPGTNPLVVQGLPLGQYVERYGFMCAGSNACKGQAAQADLDSTGGAQPTLAISAVAANTDFTAGDIQTSTVLGAVNLTLTTTGALQNVAVGQIARLGADANPATAYGVVLRIAGNVVTLVPFAANGLQLSAAQITAGTDRFSIPLIPSISPAFHREALLFATRPLAPPSPGSGASVASIPDRMTGLLVQVFSGSYDINFLREAQRSVMLTGSLLSDYRKSVLIISN